MSSSRFVARARACFLVLSRSSRARACARAPSHPLTRRAAGPGPAKRGVAAWHVSVGAQLAAAGAARRDQQKERAAARQGRGRGEASRRPHCVHAPGRPQQCARHVQVVADQLARGRGRRARRVAAARAARAAAAVCSAVPGGGRAAPRHQVRSRALAPAVRTHARAPTPQQLAHAHGMARAQNLGLARRDAVAQWSGQQLPRLFAGLANRPRPSRSARRKHGCVCRRACERCRRRGLGGQRVQRWRTSGWVWYDVGVTGLAHHCGRARRAFHVRAADTRKTDAAVRACARTYTSTRTRTPSHTHMCVHVSLSYLTRESRGLV